MKAIELKQKIVEYVDLLDEDQFGYQFWQTILKSEKLQITQMSKH